jgi:Type IV secretion system pilin
MKLLLSFLLISFMALCFATIPAHHVLAVDNSTGNYTPLAPLPGTTINANCDPTQNNCQTNFATYLPGIFRLAIGVAGALAVIMIVIGGVQYLSTDALSGKSEGKEKITNALIGLLLAIGAFVILNTINPGTLSLNLSLSPVATTSPSQPLTPTTPSTPSAAGSTLTSNTCPPQKGGNTQCICNSCVNGLSALVFKTGPQTNTYLTSALLNKLSQVPDNTTVNLPSPANGGAGYNVYINWQITEAWPPTVSHLDSCHYTGTCVDLNTVPGFISGSQPSQYMVLQLAALANQLKDQGFSVVIYEVSQSDYNALMSAGKLYQVDMSFLHLEYTTTTAPSFHVAL